MATQGNDSDKKGPSKDQLDLTLGMVAAMKDLAAQGALVEESFQSQAESMMAICEAMKCLESSAAVTQLQNVNNALKQITGSVSQLESSSKAIKGLADSATGAANQTKNLGTQTGLTDKKLKDLTANIEKSSKSASGLGKVFKSGLGIAAATAGGAISGLIGGFRTLFNVGKSIFSFAGGVVKAFGKIGMSIISIPFKMLDALTDMADNVSGAISELAQSANDLRQEFGSLSGPINSSIIKTAKSMEGLALSGTKVFSVFGNVAERQKLLMELYKGGSNIRSFSDEIEDGNGAILGFQRGLGLTIEDMNSLAGRAKIAGEPLTKSLLRITNLADKMGKEFKLESKVISRALGAASKDMLHFGHLSETQLTASVVYAEKLGTSLDKIAGAMDKFSTFDDAAENVARLNEAFNANIDLGEVMKETDVTKQYEIIRKGLMRAGVQGENLLPTEKRLLEAHAGMTAEMAGLALSRNNAGISLDKLSKKSKEASKTTITQADAMIKLSDAMERTLKATDPPGGKGFFGKFINGITDGIQRTPAFVGLMFNLKASLLDVATAGRQVGTSFVDNFPGVKDMLGGLTDLFKPATFKKLTTGVVSVFTQFFKDLETGKASFPDLMDRLKKYFFDFLDAEAPGAKKFVSGFSKFTLILTKIFAQMGQWAMEQLTKLITAITEIIANPAEAIAKAQAVASGAAAAGKGYISPLTEAFAKAGPPLWDALSKLFHTIWDKLKPELEALWAKAEKYIKGFLLTRMIQGSIMSGGAAVIGAALKARTTNKILAAIAAGPAASAAAGAAPAAASAAASAVPAAAAIIPPKVILPDPPRPPPPPPGGLRSATNAASLAAMRDAAKQSGGVAAQGPGLPPPSLPPLPPAPGPAATKNLDDLAKAGNKVDYSGVKKFLVGFAGVMLIGLVAFFAALAIIRLFDAKPAEILAVGVLIVLIAAAAFGVANALAVISKIEVPDTGKMVKFFVAMALVMAAGLLAIAGIILLVKVMKPTDDDMLTIIKLIGAMALVFIAGAGIAALAGLIGKITDPVSLIVGVIAIGLVVGAMILMVAALRLATAGLDESTMEPLGKLMLSMAVTFLIAAGVAFAAMGIGALVSSGLGAVFMLAGLVAIARVVATMVTVVMEIMVSLNEFKASEDLKAKAEAFAKIMDSVVNLTSKISDILGIVSKIVATSQSSSAITELTAFIKTLLEGEDGKGGLKGVIHELIEGIKVIDQSKIAAIKVFAELIGSMGNMIGSLAPIIKSFDNDLQRLGNGALAVDPGAAVEKMKSAGELIEKIMKGSKELTDTIMRSISAIPISTLEKLEKSGPAIAAILQASAAVMKSINIDPESIKEEYSQTNKASFGWGLADSDLSTKQNVINTEAIEKLTTYVNTTSGMFKTVVPALIDAIARSAVLAFKDLKPEHMAGVAEIAKIISSIGIMINGLIDANKKPVVVNLSNAKGSVQTVTNGAIVINSTATPIKAMLEAVIEKIPDLIDVLIETANKVAIVPNIVKHVEILTKFFGLLPPLIGLVESLGKIFPAGSDIPDGPAPASGRDLSFALLNVAMFLDTLINGGEETGSGGSLGAFKSPLAKLIATMSCAEPLMADLKTVNPKMLAMANFFLSLHNMINEINKITQVFTANSGDSASGVVAPAVKRGATKLELSIENTIQFLDTILKPKGPVDKLVSKITEYKIGDIALAVAKAKKIEEAFTAIGSLTSSIHTNFGTFGNVSPSIPTLPPPPPGPTDLKAQLQPPSTPGEFGAGTPEEFDAQLAAKQSIQPVDILALNDPNRLPTTEEQAAKALSGITGANQILAGAAKMLNDKEAGNMSESLTTLSTTIATLKTKIKSVDGLKDIFAAIETVVNTITKSLSSVVSETKDADGVTSNELIDRLITTQHFMEKLSEENGAFSSLTASIRKLPVSDENAELTKDIFKTTEFLIETLKVKEALCGIRVENYSTDDTAFFGLLDSTSVFFNSVGIKLNPVLAVVAEMCKSMAAITPNISADTVTSALNTVETVYNAIASSPFLSATNTSATDLSILAESIQQGIVPAMNAVTDMIGAAGRLETALQAGASIDIDSKLKVFAAKFGSNIGAGGAYTVKTKDVVITVNLKVTMNAGDVEGAILGKSGPIKTTINRLIEAVQNTTSAAKEAQKINQI